MSARGRSEGNAIQHWFFNFANILVQILIYAVVVRALISWFPIDPRNPFMVILNEITEPILRPLRRVVPRLGMVDITPMVAIIVLFVIQRALGSAG